MPQVGNTFFRTLRGKTSVTRSARGRLLFVRAHRFFVFSTLAGITQRLQRAVDTVAGIAQAGNDVGGLVEMVVDSAGIDMHVGILLGQ